MSEFHKMRQAMQGKWGYLALYSFLFLIIAAASLALSIFSPLFLFATVPLLFSPGFVTAYASSRKAIREKEVVLDGREHWQRFRSYWGSVAPKALCSMRCVLLAALAYVISLVAFAMIFSSFGEALWPGFNDAWYEFYAYSSTSLTDAANLLLEGGPLLSFLRCVQTVALGIGLLFFLYVYLQHAVYLAMALPYPGPLYAFGMSVRFRAFGLRRSIPGYTGRFFAYAGVSLGAFALGYAGGAAIGLLTSSSYYVPYALALLGGLLFFVISLPYCFARLYFLGESCRIPFCEERLGAAKAEFARYEQMGQMVPLADLEQMRESIRRMEKMVEKLKAEANENPDQKQ